MKAIRQFALPITLLMLFTLLLAACAAPVAPAADAPAAATEAPAEEGAVDGDAEGDADMALAPLDPAEEVRVAYVPIMKFAPLYVAAERGLFEKYGLDVDINSVKSGTEAIAFLSEGQVDVGGIAIVTSLWNGWDQGLDLRVFAPGGLEPFENSPTKLIVRKELADDGSVSEVADLAGMTVGVAGGPGSGGEYLLAKALERGDLSIFDVNLVQIGNADMPLAFENGSIDAGILGSPYADQVIESGFGEPLAEDLTPGLMTVAFVGSGDFINERPEAAQRFALALMEAARLMQGDDYLSDENLAAYLSYVNSTEEALRAGTPVVYDPNQVIPVDGLADVEETHRENGRTEYETPIDLGNVVDTSFTEQALELLGEYGAD
jgi:NitT/TauT family transport system substrate-binding protein